MLRRILISMVFVGACAGGEREDEFCTGPGCSGPPPLTAGSEESGEDTGEAPTGGEESGEAPYCDDGDRRCVGPDAVQFCDESGSKLITVSCQAACGMDMVSLGCVDEDGAVGCVCGEPDGTTGGDDTTGDDTTGDDTTSDDTTGGEPDETTGDDTTGDPVCDEGIVCPGQHGVPAGCWAPFTDCSSIVECPWGYAACEEGGFAVDCENKLCLPIKQGYETTNAKCSNGMDDDGDGYVDCDDLFCHMPNVTVCNGESTDYECMNGLDDDDDGYEDCEDFDCQLSPAVTWCTQQEWRDEACSNTVDDDVDGTSDCDDWSCYTAYGNVCW